MKTAKFTPKLCSEQVDKKGVTHPPLFSGHITLKVPNFYERQNLKAILMGAFVIDGQTDLEDMKVDTKNIKLPELMEKMGKLVSLSEPFYQEVELEHLVTGVKFKSFEDLNYEKDAEGILQEVAQELSNGFNLSKNS